MIEKTYLLDAQKLSDRIEALELRRWWIAEQLNIDRITVSRWLTGRTKKIKESNLENLVRLLDCRAQDITVAREPIVGASKQDCLIAVEQILAKDLIYLLAPSEDFALAEKIMKALVHPDLPTHLLAQLYLKISTSLWRQQKFQEAKRCVKRSIEMAIDADASNDEYRARLQLALLEMFSGSVLEAKLQFEAIMHSSVSPQSFFKVAECKCCDSTARCRKR